MNRIYKKLPLLLICLITNIFAATHSIIAVGDIMLGSDYPNARRLPPNHANLLAATSTILQSADITVGNLEGTLFNKDYSQEAYNLKDLLPNLGNQQKQCNNPKLCYLFRTPARYARYLKAAGFDFLSLANNHSNDFGHSGRIATMYHLHQQGIKYAGLDIAEYDLLEKDGVTYGFIAFAPNYRTLNINDWEGSAMLIREVKAQADIVIVLFHGGAEGSGHQRIPRRYEYFHGENRGDVYRFAHHAIENGADLVFGQGPHVTRAIERYRRKFISYSAGNFATYGFGLSGAGGVAPIFRITVDDSGDFIYGHIVPVRQHPRGKGPQIDPNKTVIKTIIHLNKMDFPKGNCLNVSSNGLVTPNHNCKHN